MGVITPERIEAERRAGMSERKIRQEFIAASRPRTTIN
jgi:hypothetical protein